MKTTISAALSLGLALASGTAQAADPARGKMVFDRWCMGCHAPMDKSVGFAPPAGTYTLEQRYKGSLPSALEQRTDLNGTYIKTLVRSGINIMPQSRKTEISDTDLDNIVAYLTQKK